jgi:GNAT superfamily N-acetyltransferase
MPIISIAGTDHEIQRCYPVMAQLRPHIAREKFLEQVRRQRQAGGFLLAALEEDGAVRCVAGFRVLECLYSGRFLYVDDLVTDSESRSKGYGGMLLDWLASYGKDQQCGVLRLDSGVQRKDAHRFYLEKGMEITCYHFALPLA